MRSETIIIAVDLKRQLFLEQQEFYILWITQVYIIGLQFSNEKKTQLILDDPDGIRPRRISWGNCSGRMESKWMIEIEAGAASFSGGGGVPKDHKNPQYT